MCLECTACLEIFLASVLSLQPLIWCVEAQCVEKYMHYPEEKFCFNLQKRTLTASIALIDVFLKNLIRVKICGCPINI